MDGDLRGCLFGLDLNTKLEEIYKALIEATAYGAKRIIGIYEENGIQINKLYAAGGIAEKDELLMQIYADVLGREIFLSGTKQACAYGSAVLGAVNKNGYSSLIEAAENMKKSTQFHINLILKTPKSMLHYMKNTKHFPSSLQTAKTKQWKF